MERQGPQMGPTVVNGTAGDRVAASTYLEQLSDLAVRSFASTGDATQAILRLVAQQLGMRTSFLARITRQPDEFLVLAAHNDLGGPDVKPGTRCALPDTY